MCVHPGFPAERWGRMIPALHRKGHPMAHCEVVQVPRRGRDVVELRAAPAHEPLASCAFEWPRGWRAHTTDWQPPALFETAYLFGLTAAPGDALTVGVARFGVEVDALAFLREKLGTAVGERAVRSAWTGLSVAALELPAPESSWRVVCSGPAVHLLEARGLARRYVDRAAATLRSLSGFEPPAERYGQAAVGPLRCLRPAAWPIVSEPAAHGYHRAHCLRTTNEGHLAAYLRVHVVDRRVHAGSPPAALLARVESDLTRDGLALGTPTDDAGPGGPTTRRTGTWRGQSVESRHAVRQIGPLLVSLDGAWPGAERAPLTRLNARRAFDVAVATLAFGG
jgi:hypothetical protein